ncbi:hypothetical protein KCTC32516_00776 [Polaribacter huanghezhanensis]|nr:hypothetical protein KCTC32516_00776 [Polaribacter huanghezhanensis]
MKKILKPNNLIIAFVSKTMLYLAFVLAIHLTILLVIKKPLFEHQIILTYSVNFLLAILIFIAMLFFSKKAIAYLGYIFMYGSLFKFTVFFIFFYPNYNKNSGSSKQEFITFFVPYLVCLILEIKSLIHLLNSSEKKD